MAMNGVTMEPSDREVQLPRRKKTDPQPAPARWLRVWDVNGDEVRMATILNLALLMGGVASIVVPTFFAVAHALTSPLLVLGGASLVGHGLGLFFNKRGAYRPVAAAYVPFVFVLLALAILTGGGIAFQPVGVFRVADGDCCWLPLPWGDARPVSGDRTVGGGDLRRGGDRRLRPAMGSGCRDPA